MRDQVLVASADPGEVTDAELAALAERCGEAEARRGGQRASACRGSPRGGRGQPPLAELLSLRNVEAENIPMIVRHINILTVVDSFFPGLLTLTRRRSASARRCAPRCRASIARAAPPRTPRRAGGRAAHEAGGPPRTERPAGRAAVAPSEPARAGCAHVRVAASGRRDVAPVASRRRQLRRRESCTATACTRRCRTSRRRTRAFAHRRRADRRRGRARAPVPG